MSAHIKSYLLPLINPGKTYILKAKTALFVIACLLVVLLAVCNRGHVTGEPGKADAPPHRPFFVGYRILDFKYLNDGGEKTLTAAVWYPTAAQPGKHNYGGSTDGNVAVDAAPLDNQGPYPLLVFSHGYGGSGLGSVFFTEHLAAAGWIVVAPDHHDRHSAVRIRSGQKKAFDRRGFLRHAKEISSSSPEDRHRYLYRLDEMRLVLDRMLDHESFARLIDRKRIAVGGHSLGGYTALGLCGTIKERHDARIRAVLLFSTGAGGYLFTQEELGKVRMPSMLYIGQRERNQKREAQTMFALAHKIYSSMSAPKYFLEVKGANHFAFNNRFADNRRTRLLSGTEEQFEVIRRYSIAFLEKHVAGNRDAGFVLERSDPMLSRYIFMQSNPTEEDPLSSKSFSVYSGSGCFHL
jgi:predicted dienelactone hydrolase